MTATIDPILDEETLLAATDPAPALAQCRVVTPAQAAQGPRNFAARIGDGWHVHLTHAAGWRYHRASTDFTTGAGKHPKMALWWMTESLAVRIRDTNDGSLRAAAHYIKLGNRAWTVDVCLWWRIIPETLGRPVPTLYEWPRPIGLTDLQTALADADPVPMLLAGSVAEIARRAKAAEKAKKATTEQVAA